MGNQFLKLISPSQKPYTECFYADDDDEIYKPNEIPFTRQFGVKPLILYRGDKAIGKILTINGNGYEVCIGCKIYDDYAKSYIIRHGEMWIKKENRTNINCNFYFVNNILVLMHILTYPNPITREYKVLNGKTYCLQSCRNWEKQKIIERLDKQVTVLMRRSFYVGTFFVDYASEEMNIKELWNVHILFNLCIPKKIYWIYYEQLKLEYMFLIEMKMRTLGEMKILYDQQISKIITKFIPRPNIFCDFDS